MFAKNHLESFRDSLPEGDKRREDLHQAINHVDWIKFGDDKRPESSQNLACTDRELEKHLQVTRVQDFAEASYAVVMKTAAMGRKLNGVVDQQSSD